YGIYRGRDRTWYEHCEQRERIDLRIQKSYRL
ncbi:hypothetical protein DYADSP32_3517, partial [Dyadobacter sp. 32]